MHVQSADGKLGALLEVDADTNEVTIPLKPVASAQGGLVDGPTGEPLVDRELTYGITVYIGENDDAPFRTAFGGTTRTDAEGKFVVNRLVPGGDYKLNLTIVENERWSRVGNVQPKDAEVIDVGKIEVKPLEDYKPPTIAERIKTAFTHEKTPLERYEAALADVKLSRQRVLLLFANPVGEATTQFMTLRYDDDDVQSAFDEFRLVAANSSPPNDEAAKRLAEKLQQTLDEEASKFLLLVVDEDSQRIDALKASDLITGTAIDRKKVLALLKKHTQEPLDARTLLKEALEQAKRENKRVILQETATWCGPCWLLSRFVDKHRSAWEADYVWVKMDHRWTGARELMTELRDGAEGGIPWWAILDAEGKKLATSNQTDGENIGFPSTPEAVEHFQAMLTRSAQRMTADQIGTLVKDLQIRN
jgi:hypothetical protein